MKHLVSIGDLTREDAISILDHASELLTLNMQANKKLPTLQSKTVVNLFFENSTRTKISFELAAKRLSADVINFNASSSSLAKGESLKDTAQTLEALGADAVVIRHPSSGAAHNLANRGWLTAGIVNAGDGTNEHPTQALLDALTLRDAFGFAKGEGLDGKRILIVGDILHSRVAGSNLLLLPLLGAEVVVAGPGTLTPQDSNFRDLDHALQMQPDAVMMLRVQRERMAGNMFPSEREYSKFWGLSAERVTKNPNIIVLHPGPMNRGLEISSRAADGSGSRILQQVSNGLAVRMAVLHRLFEGAE